MLPDKTENTYRPTRLFQELVAAAAGIQRQLRPQVVHTDFEMAAINALYTVFGVNSTGCLFHFTQYIYRKLTALGLTVEYNTDIPQGTRKWIRRNMALPLVRPRRIGGTISAYDDDSRPMYLSSYQAFLAAKPDRLHHQTTLSFWFLERHSGHYRQYGNPGASIHGQHWGGAVSLPPFTPFCFPLSSPLPPSPLPFFPSEWGIAPIGPLNPPLLIID